MITKNILLFTILSFSLAFSAFAEVYRIVDEEGKITYTDAPPHDAPTKEKVHLPAANIQPALKTAPMVEAVEEEVDGYQEITILAPTQDTTIPPGQETVAVQVGLKPTLKAGHLIQLLFNGQSYGLPTATTSFSIGSLVRGEHSVQIQVIDTEGNVIGLSNTATIHVKRGSAQH
ncbi:MAG: DUF4124 domain-containing protein [Porticoccus sp.]|nr:DUF4124 domain-containing protein [Porticoccus sp.]